MRVVAAGDAVGAALPSVLRLGAAAVIALLLGAEDQGGNAAAYAALVASLYVGLVGG